MSRDLWGYYCLTAHAFPINAGRQARFLAEQNPQTLSGGQAHLGGDGVQGRVGFRQKATDMTQPQGGEGLFGGSAFGLLEKAIELCPADLREIRHLLHGDGGGVMAFHIPAGPVVMLPRQARIRPPARYAGQKAQKTAHGRKPARFQMQRVVFNLPQDFQGGAGVLAGEDAFFR